MTKREVQRVASKDVKDFNNQIDQIRNELQDEANFEISNRMEIARRVFNHWVETGKVEIPD